MASLEVLTREARALANGEVLLTAPEAEVARQMTICNACRYCEGFCAVFPAMTRRLVRVNVTVLHRRSISGMLPVPGGLLVLGRPFFHPTYQHSFSAAGSPPHHVALLVGIQDQEQWIL